MAAVKSDFAIIGGLTCWENYMPLARMVMYQQGVEIYLAPTADSRDTWQSTMEHIACEGRCYVIGCNQYFTKDDYPEDLRATIPDDRDMTLSRGGSCIISPLGKVLAGPLYDEEGLLSAEIDLDEIIRSKVASRVPCMRKLCSNRSKTFIPNEKIARIIQ